MSGREFRLCCLELKPVLAQGANQGTGVSQAGGTTTQTVEEVRAWQGQLRLSSDPQAWPASGRDFTSYSFLLLEKSQRDQRKQDDFQGFLPDFLALRSPLRELRVTSVPGHQRNAGRPLRQSTFYNLYKHLR